MVGMKTRHTRRKRRQAKMQRKSGGKFKVGHASKSGRTGSIHAKKTKGSD